MHETRTAWFHCFAGIAGDMALGSLLDAGADVDEVRTLLKRIPITGWDLRVEETLRGGIACTRAVVAARDDVIVRTHTHIAAMVTEAKLPERVTARALAIFEVLAQVEGRLHRRPPEQVHFHEVGGQDAIVDIVGTAAALEVLDVARVSASAVATGTGTVRSAHGLLPNPSPAVVALLRGAPTYGREINVELTTPTGAAILVGLGATFGPMPLMEVRASGFGAGNHELDELPNCVQVVLGDAVGASAEEPGQPVVELEANLDDVTGEQLAYAVSSLLEAGAHDAWVSQVLMKKGRPGYVLHALCDPALMPALREHLRATTGTFGVRAHTLGRWPSARTFDEVVVRGELIRIKVGPDRIKAEFDDVARVARSSGLSVHEVASEAEAAWRAKGTGATSAPPQGDEPA